MIKYEIVEDDPVQGTDATVLIEFFQRITLPLSQALVGYSGLGDFFMLVTL